MWTRPLCPPRPNFQLIKGQCVQSKWDGGAPQTILAYPQDRLATGWRVNEARRPPGSLT